MQFGFGVGPDTSWMREELTKLGVEEFYNISNDELIHDLFSPLNAENTIKNLQVDDIILIKSVDGNYGALLVKSWEDNSDGKIVFDLLKPE